MSLDTLIAQLIQAGHSLNSIKNMTRRQLRLFYNQTQQQKEQQQKDRLNDISMMLTGKIMS